MEVEIGSFLTEINKNLEFQLGVLTAIITSIASVIASAIVGFSIFLIKRYLSKNDFEHQQNIEHSLWLLKKLHSFAEKYYSHLTRKLINAEDRINKAIYTKDDALTQQAFDSITKLIQKYDSFEKETGANIVFIEQSQQNVAIGKMHSLFLSLPFDREDFHSIIANKNKREFQSFKNWITSVNCNNSKKIVQERLFELRSMFDKQTEKILQHEDFLATRNKKTSIFTKIMNKFSKIEDGDEQFYVHEINPKYVKPGQTIQIFGNGFSTKGIKFGFKLKNSSLTKKIIHDTVSEVTIPLSIPIGTYDITCENIILNEKKIEEPMGLVIHISK